MIRLSSLAALVLVLYMTGCSSRSKELKNAETYLTVGEFAKAKELIDLELQTNPKNVDAYIMSARVYLMMGDPPDARAAFDKALLLDTGVKGQISKVYFEAAKGVAEKNGDNAIPLIAAYLQEAGTLDPGLHGKILDWALSRAKTESAATKTTAPIALLQAVGKAVPNSADRIGSALLDIAKTYANKNFAHEAAAYAMAAGEESAGKLAEASRILSSTCSLLPPEDRGFAISCLEKAIQWNPALAKDDDLYWLLNVSLRNSGEAGARTYLAAFPTGKHAAEAQAITSAAEKAAEDSPERRFANSICEDTQDGRPGSVLRDLSAQQIDRFTIDLHPGCFSGYILLPQSWEFYRMEAVNPTPSWWLAYQWYQSKNSGAGANPPLRAGQLTTMRHGSHKIRVQGIGQLAFYPIQ